MLDWGKRNPVWLSHYKKLLQLRARAIAPRRFGPGKYHMFGERAFVVQWDGLMLIANCSNNAITVTGFPGDKPLWSNGRPGDPWSVNWWLTK